MPESIITFTSGGLANIFEPVAQLWTDLWVLIALAIGIPLFFYIAGRAKTWFGR